MKEDTNQPVIKIRDGSLTATAWSRRSPEGKLRIRCRIVRSYQDEKGGWRESPEFSGAELLRIARLAERAYDEEQRLRREAQPT